MNTRLLLLALTLSVLAVFALGAADPLKQAPPDGPPPAEEDTAASVVEGNTAFAFDLYHQLRGHEDGNLFYSPYSISLAAGMVYAGARGETAREMAEIMHFDAVPADRFHEGLHAVQEQVLADPPRRTEEPLELHVANTLFGQQGHPWLDAYLDLVRDNYGAGLNQVDFARSPERARERINTWVEDQTNDRIEDLLPPGFCDPATKLVLVNAIYFKAAWESKFQERSTRDCAFHLLDGEEIEVPTMTQMSHYPYADGDGYKAVELPYAGHNASMVVLMPDAGSFAEFEADLDGETLADVLGALHGQQVLLRLPKFETTLAMDLKAELEGMGMDVAFRYPESDFSGMDGPDSELYISGAVHKAFVLVDESGTEAAAATAFGMRAGGAPPRPIDLNIDRPFLFFIRHIPSNTILFMGRVMDPSDTGEE